MSWWAQKRSCHRSTNDSTVHWHWKKKSLTTSREQIQIKKIIMENITEIRYSPLPPDSPYVKPFRMYYVQNGKEKNWDLLKVHDSVSIIILNKTRNKLVFVKQFRPGELCSFFLFVNRIAIDFFFFHTRSCLSFINYVRSNEYDTGENRSGEISSTIGHYAWTLCRHRR